MAQQRERQEIVNEMLAELGSSERQVISLRFGLNDGIDRTLAQVGRQMGLTRERVRQIEKKAIEKLSTLSEEIHDLEK